ncbi:hypothetical protein ACFELO_07530 [Oceanicaulis sp. LC35]|uniref:hypothetical protein n=1 Tax=Oceanicaulis sp. LC35 TaxID=3349635 RepID=UPI003F832853
MNAAVEQLIDSVLIDFNPGFFIQCSIAALVISGLMVLVNAIVTRQQWLHFGTNAVHQMSLFGLVIGLLASGVVLWFAFRDQISFRTGVVLIGILLANFCYFLFYCKFLVWLNARLADPSSRLIDLAFYDALWSLLPAALTLTFFFYLVF